MAPSIHRLIATVLCLPISYVCAHAPNRTLDPQFFPELSAHSDTAVRLRGLAELYPGTIHFESPELSPRSQREEAARIEKLPQAITYIRIYRLEEAIPVIREAIQAPALILDMRYLQSPSTGTDLARLLCEEAVLHDLSPLGSVPPSTLQELEPEATAPTARRSPAIVLCNRETAGPFEAILDRLQTNRQIIAVGEATAGRTGFYKKATEHTWIIEGELRPHPDRSLIATGFIPSIQIESTPEANYISYHLYEAGTELTRLLNSANTVTNESADDAEITFEPDAVLQRGVDVVAALQILQQLPVNQ